MKKQMVVCAVALMSVASVAFAAQPSDGLTGTKNSNASESAIIVSTIRQQQLHQRNIDLAFAPVKSRVDLSKYLAKTSIAKSPLRYIPPQKRHRFLSSLRFNSKGLTSFSYKPLVSSGLSATQIRNILSLFGMQSAASTFKGARVLSHKDELIMAYPNLLDHEDYMCESRATCATWTGKICTSNC